MQKNKIDKLRKLVSRLSGINHTTVKKKDGVIKGLLAIEKRLIQKDKVQKQNEKRINEILQVVTELAQLNYKKKAVVTNNFDHYDALALGINMLGEELQSSTI